MRANFQKSGFTLVELLIVIIVIAVLAAIAIPKFVNSSARSKEASLHADLKLMRDAVELFHNDTGTFPRTLDVLSANIAANNGSDPTGASIPIDPRNWHGPYIATIPTDPVSGYGLMLSVTSPSVGQIYSSATGKDSIGVPFSSY